MWLKLFLKLFILSLSACVSWLIYKHREDKVVFGDDFGLESVEKDGEMQQYLPFPCRESHLLTSAKSPAPFF